jgi:hypothetical protein
MAGDHARGEALLVRMRRLTALAASPDVRAEPTRALALLDEIETARQSLLRECAELDGRMRQAMATMNALTAYARSATAARGRRRDTH